MNSDDMIRELNFAVRSMNEKMTGLVQTTAEIKSLGLSEKERREGQDSAIEKNADEIKEVRTWAQNFFDSIREELGKLRTKVALISVGASSVVAVGAKLLM